MRGMSVGVWVIWAAMCGSVSAEVALEETPELWRVSNGAIELTIERERNYVRSLRVPGGPELMAEGGGYWDSVSHREIAGKDEKIYSRLGHHAPVITEVARRTPELVDLCVRTDPAQMDLSNRLHAALEFEVHYVVVDGLAGVYVYAMARHGEEMPTTEFGQTRHVMRVDPYVMRRYALSDERQGELAPIEEFEQAETVGDATFQLPNGRVVTKYQYSTANAESPVFGFVNGDGTLGMWAVRASDEYMTGGPTKQNLTIQNGGIWQVEVQNGHYLGPSTSLEMTGEWEKVYGPWLYYVNQGESAEALWADASERAAMEARAWPYEWCNETLGEERYPLVRGSVQGRVVDAEGEAAGDAWVILGADEPNWQSQGRGYVFWARSDEEGRYQIDNVRAGVYTAYAWREGTPEEARLDGVQVIAGETSAVADLGLPGEAGELLWQIGTADRSAAEFRRGDDFRHWNIVGRYAEDFPKGVTFEVGRSVEREEWNCVQPGPTVHEDRSRTEHLWTVVFDLEEARDCVLTIGAADCSYRPPAGIEVSVNEEAAGRVQLEPGDSAAYRCGIRGYYQVARIAVAEEFLRAGENRLELWLPNSGAWVMYDFVGMRGTVTAAMGNGQ